MKSLLNILRKYYYLLAPIVLSIVAAYNGWRGTYKLVYHIVYCGLLVITLTSPYVIAKQRLIGIVYYIIPTTTLFTLILVTAFYTRFEFLTNLFWVILSISVFSFFVAVPTVLLKRFRIHRQKTDLSKFISTDFLNESCTNIMQAFRQIQTTIMRETKDIDQAFINLQVALSTQQKALDLVSQELQEKQIELEEYKELASLTRKQQEAFFHMLSRHKYFDYVVGFILGVLGSALVASLPYFIQAINTP